MRKALLTLGACAVAGVAAGLWLTRAEGLPAAAQAAIADAPADTDRGARVFHAAGCASCHMAPEAEPSDLPVLAGGHALQTEFGTFYAPNVSMHPEAGIGGWTLAQFADAVQAGVSPSGAHYYPAFPYGSYRLATPGDVADLWAFWQSLPASDTPSRPHDLAFPYSIRRTVGVWKRMALPDGWYTPTPDDPEAARGQYLAEALAHCGECHSPRDALGAIDTARWFQGAPNPSGRGNIPPINASELGWSEAEIANYLTDGFSPQFEPAGGSMTSVVRNTARLPEEDRRAIAAYLAQVE
ncbi:cytochrome c [Jannaschia seohaensis]|uniref:Cytochrome c, mono- and diheme variants n=1 Tax=Jannaschia seohaensis TaxID=475081 RepID=A0A2Y9AJQ0_9RHOB|nr:cytochrome c [Jannaschia seohaensis]PWJ20454.1 mono/diheme cytochrome c family protein [Jannaschia seohaensis]SSA44550.1 Cytochrome c, mono- and diheme variants [Jannaschia seohaensis]